MAGTGFQWQTRNKISNKSHKQRAKSYDGWSRKISICFDIKNTSSKVSEWCSGSNALSLWHSTWDLKYNAYGNGIQVKVSLYTVLREREG